MSTHRHHFDSHFWISYSFSTNAQFGNCAWSFLAVVWLAQLYVEYCDMHCLNVCMTVCLLVCSGETALRDILAQFETAYLSKSLSRLIDPINLVFSSSSASPPTDDEIEGIVKVISRSSVHSLLWTASERSWYISVLIFSPGIDVMWHIVEFYVVTST